MANYKEHLTRSYLEGIGVTDVTEDGKRIEIYGHWEVLQYDQCMINKDGTVRHKMVCKIADRERNQQLKAEGKRPAARLFAVSRVVYAWYHNCVESYCDIWNDDGDYKNNSISNLSKHYRPETILKAKRKEKTELWEPEK